MSKEIDEYTFGRRLDREPGMEFPADDIEEPEEVEEVQEDEFTEEVAKRYFSMIFSEIDKINPFLTLEGLRLVYEMNKI